MKTNVLRATLAILCFVTFAVGNSHCQASIIYTITGSGSGSVGATAFSNAPFTFTISANPGNIVQLSGGVIEVQATSSLVNISGFSPALFTLPERLFINHTYGIAGLARTASRGGADLIDFNSPAFFTYDLASPVGPLANLPIVSISQFLNEPSTIGNISFTSSSRVTFTATLEAVPEPTGILTGLLCLGLPAMRRRR